MAKRLKPLKKPKKRRFSRANIKKVRGQVKKLHPNNLSTRLYTNLGSSKTSRTRRLMALTYLASFIFGAMIIGLFLIIIVFAVFSRQLPNPTQLLERSTELSTRFYDKNDYLIYEVFGDKNRTLIRLDEVSSDTVHATLAIEDADFYKHSGYSIRGMARAVKNMIQGKTVQSGSTLTQQVIKNTLLTPEKTLIRKAKELILSLQLENRYGKEQIIQMYLNETPYGGMNYGIYSASKAYFNKLPNDLTLSEAAYLAGLPQSPSIYSYFGSNPEAGIERRNYVLYLMNQNGWTGSDGKRYYISDEDYEEATKEELNFEAAKVPLEAPHFVFYTKQYLVEILGEDMVEMGGLRVKTTLDIEVQKIAQETVTQKVEESSGLNIWNGGMVALDPKNGHIVAMVGSKGYNLDQYPEECISGTTGEDSCLFEPYLNVTTAKRQPGSAIKPITYATMLSQGYTAAYPLLDVPSKFPGARPGVPYIPENYDGEFRGVMPVRKALGNSINVAAVKALKIVGIDNMIEQAEKMGITTFTQRERYGLALTLGGGETKLLELTGAFSVFANKGVYMSPTPIIEVLDAEGNILYKPTQKGKRALTEEVAFLISDILSDDGARSEVFGFGSLLNISGHQVAVKTGTTDDKRDNYAIGFTPYIVAGVWVGNNNNDRMNPYVASGISGATPIWNTFMREYLSDKEREKFEPPESVQKMEIDKLTGGKPYEDFDRRQEWFAQGTEPTSVSEWFQRIEVCKIDGRIANSGCRDSGKTKTKTYVKITAAFPEWQSYVDAWVKEEYISDETYFPPQMVSKLDFNNGEVENKDEVNVEIVGVSNEDSVPLEFRLNIEVSSYHDLERINIYLDGDKIADDKNAPYGYNFELSTDHIGEHEFEAVAKDEDGNKGSAKVRLNVVDFSDF